MRFEQQRQDGARRMRRVESEALFELRDLNRDVFGGTAKVGGVFFRLYPYNTNPLRDGLIAPSHTDPRMPFVGRSRHAGVNTSI